MIDVGGGLLASHLQSRDSGSRIHAGECHTFSSLNPGTGDCNGEKPLALLGACIGRRRSDAIRSSKVTT